MKFVSLICTVHAERGQANAAELHSVLERVRPEVIFIEVPVTPMGSQFDIEKLDNLESIAVIQYRKKHPAVLVPVDMPTPDESFFRRAGELFRELPRKSHEYDHLMAENNKNVKISGFGYLNSDQNSEYHSALHAETLRALGLMKNSSFSKFYEYWLKIERLREEEMVSNIVRYCRENTFDTAVFLVGAAHRDSIIELSTEYALEGVQWDYSGNGAW